MGFWQLRGASWFEARDPVENEWRGYQPKITDKECRQAGSAWLMLYRLIRTVPTAREMESVNAIEKNDWFKFEVLISLSLFSLWNSRVSDEPGRVFVCVTSNSLMANSQNQCRHEACSLSRHQVPQAFICVGLSEEIERLFSNWHQVNVKLRYCHKSVNLFWRRKDDNHHMMMSAFQSLTFKR